MPVNNPLPPADFTPPNSDLNNTPQLTGINGAEPFRFWCQKVIPLVYDDSLSYYELLCKVVSYINGLLEDNKTMLDNVKKQNQAINSFEYYVNNQLNDFTKVYNQLQSYVNNYFSNLDVQAEINNKLNTMAKDGSLSTLIEPFVPALVDKWLASNITPTSPPLDASFTLANAAAQAKAAGDSFFQFQTSTMSENNFLLNFIGQKPRIAIKRRSYSPSNYPSDIRNVPAVVIFFIYDNNYYFWILPTLGTTPPQTPQPYFYYSSVNSPDENSVLEWHKFSYATSDLTSTTEPLTAVTVKNNFLSVSNTIRITENIDLFVFAKENPNTIAFSMSGIKIYNAPSQIDGYAKCIQILTTQNYTYLTILPSTSGATIGLNKLNVYVSAFNNTRKEPYELKWYVLGENKQSFNWLSFGASVTSGRYTEDGVAKTDINKAWAGMIANKKQWTLLNYATGGAAIGAASNNLSEQIVKAQSKIPSANLITISMSLNDYAQNIPLETVKSKLKTDILSILSSNNTAYLMIIFPANACSYGTQDTNWGYGFKNTAGYSLSDLQQAQKEVADELGLRFISLLDLAPFNAVSIKNYLQDNVHPTEAGHRLIANALYPLMPFQSEFDVQVLPVPEST